MPSSKIARDIDSSAGVALRNNAAAVLGMIALGARSGYEVRRAAELSVRFFWALGPPQIYAELSRLEQAGLVRGEDGSQGRRPRRTYEVTPAGREALAAWATARRSAPLELRDALMLQLFYSDVTGQADVAALLARVRERSVQALDVFDEQIMPAAMRAEQRGFAQPKVVAEFGVALHEFIVTWCDGRLRNG